MKKEPRERREIWVQRAKWRYEQRKKGQQVIQLPTNQIAEWSPEQWPSSSGESGSSREAVNDFQF